MTAPAGKPAEPEQLPEEPVSELQEEPERDEPATEPAEPDPVAPSAPLDLGTPVGQLAAGAVLVAALGGWLLYRAGGWLWVAVAVGALVVLAVLGAVLRFARPWSGRAGRALRSSGHRLGSLLGRTRSAGGRPAGAASRSLGQSRPARALSRLARAVGGGVARLAGRAPATGRKTAPAGQSTVKKAAKSGGDSVLSRSLAALRSRHRRLRDHDQWLTGALASTLHGWWQRKGDNSPQAETEASEERPNPADASHLNTTTHAGRAARSGGTVMTDFALVTHATELPTIASTYESEDMMDVKGHLELLRELPLAAGTAVRILAERLAADYPMNGDAIEALQRIYEAFGSAVEACDEASAVFAGSHEGDILRHLQPRTGEDKWNVRR
ncbi:hypothetical protein ABT294_00465 [Nonomuraea sp. NPDC000554]|uniref:hypothetical protein n=1 Tax=Nonomuraea sp. NPDC000554 TaxID=3154259 RepID=UPI00332DEC1B